MKTGLEDFGGAAERRREALGPPLPLPGRGPLLVDFGRAAPPRRGDEQRELDAGASRAPNARGTLVDGLEAFGGAPELHCAEPGGELVD